MKDLRIFERDLSNTFLVDNSILNFSFQIDNGIPAIPFISDTKDIFLLKLIDYLKILS